MRLNEISMKDFIEISCGNLSCLDCEKKEKVAAELMLAYKGIVNPAGLKSMLAEKEDDTKLNMKILMLKVCDTLNIIGDGSEAVSIMKEWMPSYSKEGDEMVRDVKNRLREAEFLQKRNNATKEEKETPQEEDIRSSFDAEIAFLMTYFKMPLDIEKTNAAVYANIVHRAHEEIKVKMRKRG